MIVTCQECQTQFRLDDAKVPETGIRVRCSRCKCAFFVESPHKPASDQAEDLAREALGAEPARAPKPETKADPAPTAPEEESDWQFNDEVDPVLGAGEAPDDLAAARDAVDDLLGGSFGAGIDPVTGAPAASEASDSDFDLAAGAFSDESAHADEAAAEDDSDFDTSDPVFAEEPDLEADFGDEIEEDDPNAVTIDRGVFTQNLAAAGGSSALDLDSELAMDPLDGPPADASGEPPPIAVELDGEGEDPFGDDADDLGSPADWDFFEEADAQPAASFARGEGAFDTFDTAAMTAGADSFEVAEPDASPTSAHRPETEVEASAGDAWFTRLRGLLGWTLVGGLWLYAGTVALLPGVVRFASRPAPIQLAGLEMVSVEGRWVENAVEGPMYVVSGAFERTGSERPADASMLRVRLLDAKGATVAAETAAVGAPIQTARLRESNPRDLRTAQERSAPSILADPLARRKRRPFMAVLGRVPANAVAFEFEVASVITPVAELDTAPALDGLAVEGRGDATDGPSAARGAVDPDESTGAR